MKTKEKITTEDAYLRASEIRRAFLRGVITQREMETALRQTDRMFGNPRFMQRFVNEAF